MKVALVGNPNTGKSTIFNSLTGVHQHIGNWPGVTVEKKEGYFYFDKEKIEVVDLPGAYSLSSYSIDEKITREFLLKENVDLVLNIIDGAALTRGLYLTFELLNMGIPVAIVITKIDVAEKKGIKIDIDRLSRILKAPIIGINARRKSDIELLKEFILKVSKKPMKGKIFRFSDDIEKLISRIEKFLKKNGVCERCRWYAIKVLEKDCEYKNIDTSRFEKEIKKIEKKYGHGIDIVISSEKYKMIDQIVSKVLTEKSISELSGIDKILTHPIYGLIAFILVLYLVFNFVFTLGSPLQELLNNLFEQFGVFISPYLGPYKGIIVDGIISGVGAVVSFFPLIFFLFFSISFLEDIGYLARASIVLEAYMRKVGLGGKSAISLLLGFGCNVPAIMSTRSIDGEKERLLTILVNPLIPCSARLAIISFFVSLFFDGNSLVAISIYMFSIFVTLAVAFIFNRLLFHTSTSEFIIDIPDFLPPSWKNIFSQTWQRSKHFLIKAGTIILLGSIFIWILSNYPEKIGTGKSLAEKIGYVIEPYMKLMGLDWRAGVSLLFGFFAKENVISTLQILYGTGSEEILKNILASNMSPLQGLVLTLITIFYVPCIPTLAAVKSEAGTKWTIFVLVYMITLATLIGIGTWYIGSVF